MTTVWRMHAAKRLASILANDLGQMRVRLDPQQCVVPTAYRDDHSYLWQHGATADDTTEALRVPAAPPGPPTRRQPTLRRPMPKNNHRRRHLPPLPGMGLPPAARTHRLVHRAQVVPRPQHFTACRPQPEPATPWRNRRRLSRNQRLRRQWEGEDLDLDAAIDVQVERRLAGADGRLFVRPGIEAPRCNDAGVARPVGVHRRRGRRQHAPAGRRAAQRCCWRVPPGRATASPSTALPPTPALRCNACGCWTSARRWMRRTRSLILGTRAAGLPHRRCAAPCHALPAGRARRPRHRAHHRRRTVGHRRLRCRYLTEDARAAVAARLWAIWCPWPGG